MSPQISVIINASAGLGYTSAWADVLADKFHSHGLNARAILVRSGAELIEAAQSAVMEGGEVVVAGGGDGTVNAVASVVIGTDTALGVLPLGSLNHFAKAMRIPLDLDEAISNIAARNIVKIDAGEVNGRVFLNNSSLGLYPDIVRTRDKQQKRLGRGKWTAFLWAALKALQRYPFLNLTIGVHNQEHKRRSPFIFIGNNEYLMQGFDIGVRERLDAGRLCLYVTHRTGRGGLLLLALRALFGRLRGARDFEAVAVTEVLIETRRKRARVAMDGEVTVMETPLRYRIRPGALRVIVPEAANTKGNRAHPNASAASVF